MKIWRIGIVARYCGFSPRGHTYTGTATNAEIALRQMKRRAKKDGLSHVVVNIIDCLGEKEFGR